MNTKIWCSSILLTLTPYVLYAQRHVELGYSGATVFHPGVNAAYGKVIGSAENDKRGSRHDLAVKFQGGYYFHRNRHTAVYGGPALEWIKTTRKGFQYGLELPVGYLRTFIPNVYEVRNDGEIRRLPLAGTHHFIISPAIRMGHTLREDYIINGWYIRNRFMIITPYSGGTTGQYFLEAGVVKTLK